MANRNMTYEQAAHAMQTGVAVEMNYRPESTSPKHLRTGINSAMVSHAALAKLLADKGFITEAEYLEWLRVEMIDEVERYEHHLTQIVGSNITLG